jgi:membrane fusion protein, copper/silver efflux system
MDRYVRISVMLLLVTVAVAGGYLVGRKTTPVRGTATVGGQRIEYVCAMHPFIVKEQEGQCPLCGMELIKKLRGTVLPGTPPLDPRQVALSPSQQVMANLATVTVAVKPFARELNATGVVTYNQERQGKVTAWVAGRLDRLLVKSVGAVVRKDRPVAEIFSVDLYNAQEQYLLAYKTIKLLNTTVSSSFPANTQMALGEARERLRTLGFREEQFEQLQKSVKPEVRVPVYSPMSGVIIEKLAQEGQYVNLGETLFSIADLSQVWVELELFESDFPLVRTGQEVAIVSQSYPGQHFSGRVTFIYPFLDPKTRTVRVRVTLPNPGMKLKPDMYVSATIKIPQVASLVVPARAVVDTGSRQVVWVEADRGVFQPRDVKAGARTQAEVQILSGLKAGEKVAESGGYLIDSEAQLTHANEVPASQTAPPPRRDGPHKSDRNVPGTGH